MSREAGFKLGAVVRAPEPLMYEYKLWDRECHRKVRHATAGDAWILMDSVYTSGRAEQGTLKIYPCPFCKGWHVGHRKIKLR
jgi:hypothetical protein